MESTGSALATCKALATLKTFTARKVLLHRYDPGFELVLCRFGLPIAIVSNDGRGGCHSWTRANQVSPPVSETQREIAEALTAARLGESALPGELADLLVSALADGVEDGAAAMALLVDFDREVAAIMAGEDQPRGDR